MNLKIPSPFKWPIFALTLFLLDAFSMNYSKATKCPVSNNETTKTTVVFLPSLRFGLPPEPDELMDALDQEEQEEYSRGKATPSRKGENSASSSGRSPGKHSKSAADNMALLDINRLRELERKRKKLREKRIRETVTAEQWAVFDRVLQDDAITGDYRDELIRITDIILTNRHFRNNNLLKHRLFEWLTEEVLITHSYADLTHAQRQKINDHVADMVITLKIVVDIWNRMLVELQGWQVEALEHFVDGKFETGRQRIEFLQKLGDLLVHSQLQEDEGIRVTLFELIGRLRDIQLPREGPDGTPWTATDFLLGTLQDVQSTVLELFPLTADFPPGDSGLHYRRALFHVYALLSEDERQDFFEMMAGARAQPLQMGWAFYERGPLHALLDMHVSTTGRLPKYGDREVDPDALLDRIDWMFAMLKEVNKLFLDEEGRHSAFDDNNPDAFSAQHLVVYDTFFLLSLANSEKFHEKVLLEIKHHGYGIHHVFKVFTSIKRIQHLWEAGLGLITRETAGRIEHNPEEEKDHHHSPSALLTDPDQLDSVVDDVEKEAGRLLKKATDPAKRGLDLFDVIAEKLRETSRVCAMCREPLENKKQSHPLECGHQIHDECHGSAHKCPVCEKHNEKKESKKEQKNIHVKHEGKSPKRDL